MVALLGGVFVVLGIFIGASQADFGLTVSVPNLSNIVSKAVGEKVMPLLEANKSITVDVTADVTGTLAAVVAVINSVNASVSKIFTATQAAVSDVNTCSIPLFTALSEAILGATHDLNNAYTAVGVFQTTVDSATYNAIFSNVSALKLHEYALNDVFETISSGAQAAETSPTPVTLENVGTFVTPAMVTSLASSLSFITTKVNNLASVFTKVISSKMKDATQVASVNATANDAVRSLASTSNTFKFWAGESSNNAVQNLNSGYSSIIASLSPIVDNSDTYNAGDISELNRYIVTLTQLNARFTNFISMNFETLQTHVFELLDTQTQLATDTLYCATRSIIYVSSSHPSQYVSTCTSKYISQLKAPPVQVSRFSSCLSPETGIFFHFDAMLVMVMRLLQNDASAISSDLVRTCTRSDGPCSLVYFSAYKDLSPQIESQLENLYAALGSKLKFLETRVATCVNATTADITDNIHTIQAKFSSCLVTGL